MNITHSFSALVIAGLLVGCGGDGPDDDEVPAQLPPAADIAVSGAVADGPVAGGRLYFFDAASIQATLDAADAADDRQASLDGASALSMVSLDANGDGTYAVDLDGSLAGSAVFVVFDNTGATDITFGDTPFNMESVGVLGDAGSARRINVTPQATVVATQVRAALPLDDTGVGNEITTAKRQCGFCVWRRSDRHGTVAGRH